MPDRLREKGREARCGSSFHSLVNPVIKLKAARMPGAIGASTPPLSITSWRPSAMCCAAYAMASVELVQPVETMCDKPRKPNAIDNSLESPPCVDAGIVYTLAFVVGPTYQYSYCCSVNARPPPPVPSSTPKARRSSSDKSLVKRRASSSASRAAASASGTVRGTCLRSFGLSCDCQSNEGTSAAIWTGKLEGSKVSILRTPLLPEISPFQNASRPIPSGVTHPIPVITTRRGRIKAFNMRLFWLRKSLIYDDKLNFLPALVAELRAGSQLCLTIRASCWSLFGPALHTELRAGRVL